MAIDTQGFDAAVLHAECGASLFARREEADDVVNFYVAMACERGQPKFGTGYYFDADACREAAKFFTALSREIERREADLDYVGGSEDGYF